VANEKVGRKIRAVSGEVHFLLEDGTRHKETFSFDAAAGDHFDMKASSNVETFSVEFSGIHKRATFEERMKRYTMGNEVPDDDG
jgi:hypothetical protein